MNRHLIAVAAASALLAGNALAHDAQEAASAEAPVMELDELLAAFGWNLDQAEIKTEELAGGIHVLFGLGGNIAVSAGEDGVLIVDDQFPQLMPKIKKALREIASDEVDIVVNTHWHFDHAEGNLALGENKNTQIVAHKNSREMMLGDHIINLVQVKYDQKAYPAHALPDIAYEKAMSFWFNGEEVALYHFGAAHTTGDTAVYFRERNAVHMGDVYNNSGYPFIDAGNGGNIDGVIAFCNAIIAQINDDTAVIPGHGPVATKADMQRYVDILVETRNRISEMAADGQSLNAIMAAAPTADFDEEMGAGPGNVEIYVNRVYTSLAANDNP